MLVLAYPLEAAIILVESGGCTLRDAIRSANADATRGDCSAGSGADTIITPDVWYETLGSTLPTIDTDLSIRTITDAGQLVISGDNEHRIMRISGANTNVTLTRVKLTEGKSPFGQSEAGAAIKITDAEVTLNAVEITDNYAKNADGAGIYIEDGELNINNSLFFHNIMEIGQVASFVNAAALFAKDSVVNISDSLFFGSLSVIGEVFVPRSSGIYITGGQLNLNRSLIDETGVWGVRAEFDVSVDIKNTTFSQSQIHQTGNPLHLSVKYDSSLRMNHVTFGNGRWTAIDNVSVDVTNSILVGCTVLPSDAWVRDHNNLRLDGRCEGAGMDEDIQLLGLSDNGGFTQTHALGSQSVAINSGATAHCLAVDQRGEPRGDACDIGAYEVNDIADIGVELQRVTPLPWGSGQDIQVNLILTNNGPGVATLIDLDWISSGLVIYEIDSFFCPSLPCTYPMIASGNQVVIPIFATINSFVGGAIELNIEAVETVNSFHHDPDPSNNQDSLSSNIVASSDLEIIKTLVTSPPFFVGQSIEYQIQVNHVGGLSASGVKLTETPSNLTITNMSGCNSVVGLVCHINSVSSNFPATITVNATIDDNSFNNIASVSANQFDPNTSNNIDSTFNGGSTSTADMQVSMSLLTGGPHYSDQFVQYKVYIKSGSEPATHLVLDSTYPGIYIGIDNCNSIPCEIPAIAPDTTFELTFSMFAPQMIPGFLESATHSVSINAGQADPDLSNNSVSITTSLIPSVDLQTNLYLITPPPYYQNQNVDYRLDIRNRGLNNVDDVLINLTDIENMELNWVSSFHCNNFPCSIPALDFDQTETIQFSARLLDVGLFDVTAVASSLYIDPLPDDNTDDSNNGGLVELLPNDLIFADGFESN